MLTTRGCSHHVFGETAQGNENPSTKTQYPRSLPPVVSFPLTVTVKTFFGKKYAPAALRHSTVASVAGVVVSRIEVQPESAIRSATPNAPHKDLGPPLFIVPSP